MPRRIAVASVAAGLAVVAFGALLLFVRPGSEQPPLPHATLNPVQERDDEDAPKRGVVGRVVTPGGRAVEGAKVTLLPLFEG